jgi:hypothetical protein
MVDQMISDQDKILMNTGRLTGSVSAEIRLHKYRLPGITEYGYPKKGDKKSLLLN